MSSKLLLKWKLSTAMEMIFGLFKTIRFNFHYFPFKQAVRFPVIISKNVKLEVLHGNVEINGKIKTGMIKMGFGAFSLFDHSHERAIFVNSSGGNLFFEGKAMLGPGFKIINNGFLKIGDNFSVTGKTKVICDNQIVFGKNDLLSWDILIMDTDYHSVVIDGIKKPITSPISIGDKVWIGARATVLKGAVIPNNSVVGAGTIISGQKYNEEGIILCGVPSRVTRQGIAWER